MKMMKRKDYQNPTTKVVKLQHRGHLLQASREVSSTVSATMDGTWTEEDI